ncbi:hypothetical protein Ahy_A01g001579 isoform A [Arachis hypogaea]|uniref:1-phosphatidylinositol-4-phosphate 5-kinase n=1 Tax=Arachis hypogaea TaxID=3818 RepID=A0A445EP75_ARAHY|nr:hypothetical protein Ahy_A01g001579 isoform A [Arachis hypogaea]
MGSLFCSKYSTHRRYDLKGSSLGRTTDKPETELSETTILKDLDLNFIFRLQPSQFEEFCSQIDRDCELLEQEGIMDYSLLVGIHFRHISPDGELVPCGSENLIVALIDSSSSNVTDRSITMVPFSKTLITPVQCKSLWRQFKTETEYSEANKRNNNWLPPPWAILALIILGFKEFMTLLRYPLYLLVIFIGYLLIKAL